MKSNKALNIGLWVVQVLLFGMFLMTGFMKLSQPIAELSNMIPWVAEVPSSMVRFIGISEVLGALGILLPALIRVKPSLTPLAGLGLAVIMLFALIFHIARGEFEAIGMNIVLGLIALFVAWGRGRKSIISPR